ncbi:MAG: hypothetical protein ACOYNI_00870 [Acidimicrobiia bacterium]
MDAETTTHDVGEPIAPPCPKHLVPALIECAACHEHWCDRCVIETRRARLTICIDCAMKKSGVRVRPRARRTQLPRHDWPLPASVANAE